MRRPPHPIWASSMALERRERGRRATSRPQTRNRAITTIVSSSAPPPICRPRKAGGRSSARGASTTNSPRPRASTTRAPTTESTAARTGTWSRRTRSETRAASPLTPTPTMFTAVPTRLASWATHQRLGATAPSSTCQPHALATGETRFTTRAARSSQPFTPTSAAPVSRQGKCSTTRSPSATPASPSSHHIQRFTPRAPPATETHSPPRGHHG